MITYVALLRGINLGGRNRVGMADLRELCLALGHADVQSYLQSGNVLFTSPVEDVSRLARDIESRIARDLDVNVRVLLRTSADLADVVADNPFLGQESDFAKLHVTFLADAPDPERTARFGAPEGVPDAFSLTAGEVYLHCPNGYGRTKLNNAYIERRLGVVATTRNWKTVTKLRDLARG